MKKQSILALLLIASSLTLSACSAPAVTNTAATDTNSARPDGFLTKKQYLKIFNCLTEKRVDLEEGTKTALASIENLSENDFLKATTDPIYETWIKDAFKVGCSL